MLYGVGKPALKMNDFLRGGVGEIGPWREGVGAIRATTDQLSTGARDQRPVPRTLRKTPKLKQEVMK